MSTKVINVRVSSIRPLGYNNLEEWMKDPNHVYIGRSGVVFVNGHRFPPEDSIFANPFRIEGETHECRKASVERFRTYARKNPLLLEELESLRGKTLGCWCKPDDCHGDVLVELLAMTPSARADFDINTSPSLSHH